MKYQNNINNTKTATASNANVMNVVVETKPVSSVSCNIFPNILTNNTANNNIVDNNDSFLR